MGKRKSEEMINVKKFSKFALTALAVTGAIIVAVVVTNQVKEPKRMYAYLLVAYYSYYYYFKF